MQTVLKNFNTIFRYWEGRRLWSQMTISIRALTRGIWIAIPEKEGKDVVEKKSVLNILVAFAFATKHYLREEYSYEYPDLKELICHLPKYSTPISTKPLLSAQKKEDEAFRRNAHDLETPTNIPIELSYYIAAYLSRFSSMSTSLMNPMQSGMRLFILTENRIIPAQLLY